jgi:NAD(P)H-quinone oxidoreductase subunit 5
MSLLNVVPVFIPPLLMLIVILLSFISSTTIEKLWQQFVILSIIAFIFTLISAALTHLTSTDLNSLEFQPWLKFSELGSILAILVQLLGTVIAAFSARYLEGEARQRRYIAGLAGVLLAVQILLLADHWVVLIAAWALVGQALQHLLCFYADRPFAILAAHKKRIADRIADVFLIIAAVLAWKTVGSGSLSALTTYVEHHGMSMALQISAVCLVLGVILRTALLPVHGWLIQAMEAPTPVSALLHAGVVNLGCFVLIIFAPLLEHALLARTLLLFFGLGTAILAGMVMLTRVSIKVHLAWSTVAQMGFMLMECSLGLYSIAILHLIGHSLYKANAFLSASSTVRQTRFTEMRGTIDHSASSIMVAPLIAMPLVVFILSLFGNSDWPIWWSAVLGLAWSPFLWLPKIKNGLRQFVLQALSGILILTLLTVSALIIHKLPIGVQDMPNEILGWIALCGLSIFYIYLVLLKLYPQSLSTWRRWSYAGFYLDEIYTLLALRLMKNGSEKHVSTPLIPHSVAGE